MARPMPLSLPVTMAALLPSDIRSSSWCRLVDDLGGRQALAGEPGRITLPPPSSDASVVPWTDPDGLASGRRRTEPVEEVVTPPGAHWPSPSAPGSTASDTLGQVAVDTSRLAELAPCRPMLQDLELALDLAETAAS